MKNTFIFLIFVIFFSGCQFIPLFSPIITGIIIWKEGQAKKYYEINTSIMYRCVKNSLRDLNIKITKDLTALIIVVFENVPFISFCSTSTVEYFFINISFCDSLNV